MWYVLLLLPLLLLLVFFFFALLQSHSINQLISETVRGKIESFLAGALLCSYSQKHFLGVPKRVGHVMMVKIIKMMFSAVSKASSVSALGLPVWRLVI